LAWQAQQLCKQQKRDIENSLFCPMLDARRMEVFTALFDHKLQVVEAVNALVVTGEDFAAFDNKEIIYFGDGASKCNALFEAKKNYRFLGAMALSGEAICMLAETEFENRNFADVAYCEPFYLKDFIAGKPRVKGLYP
jgi:tRNA threonylcarbamoyladenosine biosynthesis protein TsaB